MLNMAAASWSAAKALNSTLDDPKSIGRSGRATTGR